MVFDEIDTFELTRLLNRFKVPCNMIGFEYLKTAVICCIENPELARSITKGIYDYVAKVHNTNIPQVERNIRNAIEKAYDLGGLLTLNEFFDEIVYQNDYKFTNSEMIFNLVEIMTIKMKKRHYAQNNPEEFLNNQSKKHKYMLL